MSRIQALAPRYCPRCEASNSLYLAEGRRLRCRICNYLEAEAIPESEAPEDLPQDLPQKPLAEQFLVSYLLIHQGDVSVWARAAYDTGLDCVRRNDREGAIDGMRRALELESGFLDAHLWLGRLLDDPDLKRHHYGIIMAYVPNHFEAIRELMVLNGEVDVAGAVLGREVPVEQMDVPVAVVKDRVLQCPICGGSIHANEGQARCDFCGHVAELSRQGSGGLENLSMALIRERARPVKWVLGERYLHCNNCGAERTINKRSLSTRCPFCSSNQVIEKDALDSFRQPDGLLPFRIHEKAAQAALQDALSGRVERFKGFFVNNRVASMQLEAIYMPFWTFDASVKISRTLEERHQENKRSMWTQARLPIHENFDDSAFDELVLAVDSLPQSLVQHLDRFNMGQVLPYDPRHLARYSAELYNIDFDKASLEARSRISKRMRAKHGQMDIISDRRVSHVQAMITQMSFRLLLLPLWIGTLVEEDGDVRMALLNGQSGRVVLGSAQRQP